MIWLQKFLSDLFFVFTIVIRKNSSNGLSNIAKFLLAYWDKNGSFVLDSSDYI